MTSIRQLVTLSGLLLVASLLTGCSTNSEAAGEQKMQIVTTTVILQEFVAGVAGDRGQVTSIVPAGADPHSFEPPLTAARTVAHAQVAFSGHLLLEEQSIIKTVTANLPETSQYVELGEAATSFGLKLIPLVENIGLDTAWVGLKVGGPLAGASGEVSLNLTGVTYTPPAAHTPAGPATVSTYLTGTFGEPQLYWQATENGKQQSSAVTLPIGAHTHLSWAFSEPGRYEISLEATGGSLGLAAGKQAAATFTFIVGMPTPPAGTVIDAGHWDVTAQLTDSSPRLVLTGDGGEVAPDTAVIMVPNSALTEIPADPKYRFLGPLGGYTYQLAQAVIGKHVHGELDPHYWHDVGAMTAITDQIATSLAAADPAGASYYQSRAAAQKAQLQQLDAWVRAQITKIPPANRHLVTTHDAYGYLARAYGLKIAGFVSPTPGIEPTPTQLVGLARTMAQLQVPAVFLEPGVVQQSGTLLQLAEKNHKQVCRIYGDAFVAPVHTYVDMIQANTQSLVRCLSPGTTAEPTLFPAGWQLGATND